MFSTFKFSENHAPIQRFPTKILNSGTALSFKNALNFQYP